MPPRKEPKETVVYPASKRKPPPFKPQRPSKIPRVSTTESESTKSTRKTKDAQPMSRRISIEDDEDEDSQDGQRSAGRAAEHESDTSEDLAADPLASKPARPKRTKPPPATRKKARQPSPMSVSSEDGPDPSPPELPATADTPPEPNQVNGDVIIPQPLLIRLLHEHFADKKTKIDKHAIQVLQKYFELFVRETIARATDQKRKEAREGGDGSEVDLSWLELEDLEKVAAGMLLDF